ncbi:MAG: M20/M25/M40 family metallo-hydrolase, partial [Candidatus Latescibacterota bacterium]
MGARLEDPRKALELSRGAQDLPVEADAVAAGDRDEGDRDAGAPLLVLHDRHHVAPEAGRSPADVDGVRGGVRVDVRVDRPLLAGRLGPAPPERQVRRVGQELERLLRISRDLTGAVVRPERVVRLGEMSSGHEGPRRFVNRIVAEDSSLYSEGPPDATFDGCTGEPSSRTLEKMRMRIGISGVLTVAWFAVATATEMIAPPSPAESGVLAERLAAHVRLLASPGLGGREAGTEGERAAAEHIARAFLEIGLEPLGGADQPSRAGADFVRFFRGIAIFPDGDIRECSKRSVPDPRIPSKAMINVVGALGLELPGKALVIGAHYDHLGTKDGALHPGADDNASGVALLIETARAFAAENPQNGPVVFAAFSGEEAGLLGSRAYVCDPPLPLEKTAAMLNVDMVGRLGDAKLLFGAQGYTDSARAAIRSSLGALLPVAEMTSGYDAGDLASFAEARVPSVTLFTGAHVDYHRPGDTEDKIDYAGLARVTSAAGRAAPLLAKLASAGFIGEPTDSRAAARPEGERPYLGTLPDFAAPPGEGVLIASVAPGSPADLAGIRAGDRVIALAGAAIADLRGYAEALRERKPGDAVTIEVRRGGEALRFEATLIPRPAAPPGTGPPPGG